MKAPKCRTCGEHHWLGQCSYALTVGRRYSADEIKSEMGQAAVPTVVRKAAVARDVPRSVPKSKVTAAEAEIERQAAEIKQLKRLLAEANAKLDANANAPSANRASANAPRANAGRKPANKPKTDRRTYMRELMRKRRAAKKGLSA